MSSRSLRSGIFRYSVDSERTSIDNRADAREEEKTMADNYENGAYDTIVFETEDGEQVEFSILEQTVVGGFQYLLVAEGAVDPDETEVDVYIMRGEAPSPENADDEMASYDMVEDEEEIEAVSKIFAQIMDDTDIEVE